jgi:hypothetical protein
MMCRCYSAARLRDSPDTARASRASGLNDPARLASRKPAELSAVGDRETFVQIRRERARHNAIGCVLPVAEAPS